jgi:hypothetical protein
MLPLRRMRPCQPCVPCVRRLAAADVRKTPLQSRASARLYYYDNEIN